MALNIGSLSSTLTPNAAAQLAALARVDAMHYTADGDSVSDNALSVAGLDGAPTAGSTARYAVGTKAPSFEQALLKAMDGVSSSQNKSDDLLQKVVADPNSVDAQDVTIAMAEANMSLNLAKTILSRLVTAWRDVISTR
jgi:flagellar hook-basal body complex protein FliE